MGPGSSPDRPQGSKWCQNDVPEVDCWLILADFRREFARIFRCVLKTPHLQICISTHPIHPLCHIMPKMMSVCSHTFPYRMAYRMGGKPKVETFRFRYFYSIPLGPAIACLLPIGVFIQVQCSQTLHLLWVRSLCAGSEQPVCPAHGFCTRVR